jgi:hypothetical protein
MAATKSATSIWSGVTLSASAANTTSSAQTLTTSYGSVVNISLTNGGTGPTTAAQVLIQVSADNSHWYDFGGPLVGSTTGSAAISWGGIEIPLGVQYLRLVAGSNTGQAVTVSADISQVTAVS